MKLTLLQMVQDILSNMSSDEVNSISDTTESLQIATIIKQKYYDILTRAGMPEHNQIFNLDASLSILQPTMMFVPAGIGKIEYIKYFNSDTSGSTSVPPTPVGYQYVTMLPFNQFLDMTNQFDPGATNVDSFTFTDNSNNHPGTFTFYYKDDRQPTYCCILSNYYVIFDSFNEVLDSTLQTAKTMCFGQVIPTFTVSDSFIPDLDEQQFPLLVNEAKALAFYELKQQPHAKAETELKRQWSAVQRNKVINDRPTAFDQLPNFGRKPRRGAVVKWQ